MQETCVHQDPQATYLLPKVTHREREPAAISFQIQNRRTVSIAQWLVNPVRTLEPKYLTYNLELDLRKSTLNF